MDFAERFAQLDAWLTEHQSLWRAKPFIEHRLEWEGRFPELSQFLRSRSLGEAEAVHNAPDQLDAPAPFAELAAASLALGTVDDWTASDNQLLVSASDSSYRSDEQLGRHIPGRKWQQINRFADAALARLPDGVQCWLDWCAGKGHLGRLLAVRSSVPLVALEWDGALCEQGRALSGGCSVPAEHVQANVLAPATWSALTPTRTPVALHACGQLHMTLLTQAAARGCTRLAVSPCCYNRIDVPVYRPMSRRAQAAQLKLSRDDLALPLQESVTAGARSRRLRDQSMAWRLAFDLWQRQVRGVDEYLPTPSRPESALADGIRAFCLSLAEHHGLALIEPKSWSELEQQGWARLAEVRNLELLPALFRRPLEIWLLLDRALYLEEQGYRVQLGQFCTRELTPRNLMLVATRC
jgi:hypothetical protein